MITDLVVKVSLTGAGSAVMWFLVGMSIVSISVVIERYIFFMRHSGNTARLANRLQGLFFGQDWTQAKSVLAEEDSFASRVMTAGIESAPQGEKAVAQMALGAAKVERLRFERGLTFLGTIGNNAPFIGLFGTVLEIIAALHKLGEGSGGQVGAGAVMSELSAALAATAVGLLVALPAVAFFNYFSRRLKALQTGAEALLHMLQASLKGDSALPPA